MIEPGPCLFAFTLGALTGAASLHLLMQFARDVFRAREDGDDR